MQCHCAELHGMALINRGICRDILEVVSRLSEDLFVRIRGGIGENSHGMALTLKTVGQRAR
jgi:hypothetical protein